MKGLPTGKFVKGSVRMNSNGTIDVLIPSKSGTRKKRANPKRKRKPAVNRKRATTKRKLNPKRKLKVGSKAWVHKMQLARKRAARRRAK